MVVGSSGMGGGNYGGSSGGSGANMGGVQHSTPRHGGTRGTSSSSKAKKDTGVIGFLRNSFSGSSSKADKH